MRIVAGLYKGFSLKAPNSLKTRPTSDRARETIFNILNNYIQDYNDLEVLDVFAGSGALGLEALSRKATAATFIEIDRDAINTIHHNINHLKINDACKVLRLDATRLPHASKKFNLIFIDAPYNKGLTKKALSELFEKKWIAENAILVIEISVNEDLLLPSYLALLNERHIGITKVILATTPTMQ